MHDLSGAMQPPIGVSILRQSYRSGRIVLPPVRDHRIVVHASVATWSTCRTTGTRHLRRVAAIRGYGTTAHGAKRTLALVGVVE